MKVDVTMKRMDIIKLNLMMYPKIKSTYITIFIFILLVFTYLWWKEGFPDTPGKWYAIIFASIGGAFGAFLFGLIYEIGSILLISNEKNGVLGIHHYELKDEGLYEKTIANEGLHKWSGISEVIKTSKFILIKVNSYLFHVFPKRCFDSEEHFNEFYLQSKKLHKNHA